MSTIHSIRHLYHHVKQVHFTEMTELITKTYVFIWARWPKRKVQSEISFAIKSDVILLKRAVFPNGKVFFTTIRVYELIKQKNNHQPFLVLGNSSITIFGLTNKAEIDNQRILELIFLESNIKENSNMEISRARNK